MDARQWLSEIGNGSPKSLVDSDQAFFDMLEQLSAQETNSSWPRGGLRIDSTYARGACWIGACPSSQAKLDETGNWMFYPYNHTEKQQTFLRILKTPDDANYSMAFGTNIFDNTESYFTSLGIDTSGLIPRMPLHVTVDSKYRADNIVAAIMLLNEHDNTSEEAQKFKRFLSEMGLDASGLVSDLFERLYAGHKNIMENRSSMYRELIGIIADTAWPNWRKGKTRKDFERLGFMMRFKDIVPGWDHGFCSPSVYNIVYPKRIYDAINMLMENEIPPIMPHWAFCDNTGWLFNDRMGEPCTGARIGAVDIFERKIFAGMLNAFNFDTPGNAHKVRWDIDESWIDLFVEQCEALVEMPKSFDLRLMLDQSLEHGRKVPIFVQGSEQKYYFLLDSMELGSNNYYTPKFSEFHFVEDQEDEHVRDGSEAVPL